MEEPLIPEAPESDIEEPEVEENVEYSTSSEVVKKENTVYKLHENGSSDPQYVNIVKFVINLPYCMNKL